MRDHHQDGNADHSDKLFFTKKEVAERTRNGLRTIERLMASGELRRVSHPGRKVLIAREQVLLLEDGMRRGLM